MVKALANPLRLEIVDLLAQGPCSVEYIAAQIHQSIANASQHLQVLKNARLVEYEKRGKFTYYRLADTMVYETWQTLRNLGYNRLPEIQKLVNDYRQAKHNLESITSEELMKRVKQKDVLILDVRPAEEYDEGHIPNAISIPYNLLTNKLQELSHDTEIVAYCRGPLCALSDDAVEILKKNGYNAKRLEDGYSEWKIEGFPIDTKLSS